MTMKRKARRMAYKWVAKRAVYYTVMFFVIGTAGIATTKFLRWLSEKSGQELFLIGLLTIAVVTLIVCGYMEYSDRLKELEYKEAIKKWEKRNQK